MGEGKREETKVQTMASLELFGGNHLLLLLVLLLVSVLCWL